jgi:hypothetical protein
MVARRKLFIFWKTKPGFSFGAKLSILVKKIEFFSQIQCFSTTYLKQPKFGYDILNFYRIYMV